MDPDDFVGPDGLRELDRLCREFAEAGSPDDLENLRHLLRTRANGSYEKHDVPRIVAAAFISRGPSGVEELRRLIRDAPGHIYPLAIIETLWSASEGDLRPRSLFGIDYAPYNVFQ